MFMSANFLILGKRLVFYISFLYKEWTTKKGGYRELVSFNITKVLILALRKEGRDRETITRGTLTS